MKQDDEYTPFPPSSRGLLFFNHVISAAGLASWATHFPNCGTKKNQNLRKTAKTCTRRQKYHDQHACHEFRINLHLLKWPYEQVSFFSASLAFEDWVVFYAIDHEMPKAFLKPLRSFGYFNWSRGGDLLFTNSWESLQRTHYCSNMVFAMPQDTLVHKWGISLDGLLPKIM